MGQVVLELIYQNSVLHVLANNLRTVSVCGGGGCVGCVCVCVSVCGLLKF